VKAKSLFVIKTIALSALLFLLYAHVAVGYEWIIAGSATFLRKLFLASPVVSAKVKSVYYLIPFISALLAASGLELKRKLRWAAIGFVSYCFFDILTVASGLAVIVVRTQPVSNNLFITSGVIPAVHNLLLRILPYILLWFAINGKIENLWAPLVSAASLRVCPICGKGKTGLVEHIRSVHGEKALKSGKVRRHLVRTGIT